MLDKDTKHNSTNTDLVTKERCQKKFNNRCLKINVNCENELEPLRESR